jgi:hypothetical protein
VRQFAICVGTLNQIGIAKNVTALQCEQLQLEASALPKNWVALFQEFQLDHLPVITFCARLILVPQLWLLPPGQRRLPMVDMLQPCC